MEFPAEIVEAIFDLVDKPQQLSACARVCKDWRVSGQTRLFKSIRLLNPSKFAQLLQILQSSPHIAQAIRAVEINFAPLPTWSTNKFITDTVGEILLSLPRPTSLLLRGPHVGHRAHWTHLSYKLKTAILQVIQLPTLEELEIDGWVISIPVHTYISNFLSSSHLRRVRLFHAFSGVYSAESVPEDFEPAQLRLQDLQIWVDDHLDDNPKVTSDFRQLVHIGSVPVNELSLEIWLNMAFAAFGNIKDYFAGPVAESIQSLTLNAGLRNNYPWECSNLKQLTNLKMNARCLTSSEAIPFVRQTLSTLPEQNQLQKLSLEFCFYSLPKIQWSELMTFLTLGPFPSLKEVHFLVVTNLPVSDDEFRLPMLREHGYKASVSFSSEYMLEVSKRSFSFYLFSRY